MRYRTDSACLPGIRTPRMGPPESRIAAPGQASGVLDALRAPDRLRFALSFDSCVVSPRGCAASGAQGALLATPWTGQDRTGARAGSQPWCRGASWQMWLEQRTKKTSADTPPPGPSRSYYTHARPGGRHARCHGPSRSLRPNDDPSRRGRPRAPAARAGAPSSHRRPLVDECNTAITTGCPESTPGG